MGINISKVSIGYYMNNITNQDIGNSKSRQLEYYTVQGNPKGVWLGKGAEYSNISGTVTEEQALKLYEESRHPNTGEQLVKRRKYSADSETLNQYGRENQRGRKSVDGFDLTFEAPKDISVLWGLGTMRTRRAIQQAHYEALEEVLAWAEENVLYTRSGENGVVKEKTHGFVASRFDHWESRAGDPQLHSHVVIANNVQRASDDKWVTIDANEVYRWRSAMSQMHSNILYDKVSQKLGVQTENATLDELENHVDGINIKINGVPKELCENFSTRRKQILENYKELREQYIANTGKEPSTKVEKILKQKATFSTRQEKDKDLKSLHELQQEWRKQAKEDGFDWYAMDKSVTGHEPNFHTVEELSDELKDEIVQRALNNVVKDRVTFNAAQLRRQVEALTSNVRCRNLQDRLQIGEELTELGLEKSHVVTEHRYEHDTDFVVEAAVTKTYTTEAVLDQESLIREASEKNIDLKADEEKLEEFVQNAKTKDGFELGEDQKEAVTQTLTDGKSLSALIGPAGTGKSTTMKAVQEAWTNEHGKNMVIGLAPTAVAAEVLEEELGTKTENTAKWIFETSKERREQRQEYISTLEKRCETYAKKVKENSNPQDNKTYEKYSALLVEAKMVQEFFEFKQGQLVIVDEASMLATKDMANIVNQAQDAGAKILLVGDPSQLDAVEAGGALGWMERSGKAATLSEVHRFKNEWEKEASLQLREGDTDVLTEYEKQGKLFIGTGEEQESVIYNAWKEDTFDKGLNSLMLATDNETVSNLNIRAQQEHLNAGELDQEKGSVDLSDWEAYIGDTIVARKNDRTLIDEQGSFIKNGTMLKITDIHPYGNQITVERLDNKQEIIIPRDYFKDNCQLGYAMTVHRSQGTTVDSTHAIITDVENTSREQFYVAMTRGKQSNKAYAVVEREDLEQTVLNGQTSFKEHEKEIKDPFRKILTNSEVTKTAHEQIYDDQLYANDPSRLYQEYRRIVDSDEIVEETKILPGFAGAKLKNKKKQQLLNQIEQRLKENTAKAIAYETIHSKWFLHVNDTFPPGLAEEVACYRAVYNVQDEYAPIGQEPRDWKKKTHWNKLNTEIQNAVNIDKHNQNSRIEKSLEHSRHHSER